MSKERETLVQAMANLTRASGNNASNGAVVQQLELLGQLIDSAAEEGLEALKT